MRKIIGGKVYDTKKATLVGTWEQPENYEGAADWISESLYRKRTGEYFLEGAGGANTKYARVVRGFPFDQKEIGEELIRLSYAKAKEWSKAHLDAKRYKKFFGDVQKNQSKTSINIRVTKECADTIRRKAEEEGTNPGAVVEKLVKEA